MFEGFAAKAAPAAGRMFGRVSEEIPKLTGVLEEMWPAIEAMLQRAGQVGGYRAPVEEAMSNSELLPWLTKLGEGMGSGMAEAGNMLKGGWDEVAPYGRELVDAVAPVYDSLNNLIFTGRTPWQLLSQGKQAAEKQQWTPLAKEVLRDTFEPSTAAIAAEKQKILEAPWLNQIWDKVENNYDLWSGIPRNKSISTAADQSQRQQHAFYDYIDKMANSRVLKDYMANNASTVDTNAQILARRARDLESPETGNWMTKAGEYITGGVDSALDALRATPEMKDAIPADRYWKARPGQDFQIGWNQFRGLDRETGNLGGAGDMTDLEKNLAKLWLKFGYGPADAAAKEKLMNSKPFWDYIFPYLNPSRSIIPGASVNTYLANQAPTLLGYPTLVDAASNAASDMGDMGSILAGILGLKQESPTRTIKPWSPPPAP